MTLEEIEGHYGVKGSTWNYAETEGKAISSKILDAIRRTAPPQGKYRPDFDWLVHGTGEMLPSVGIQIAEPTVTGMLPEHVEAAYNALCEVLDGIQATPADVPRKVFARILGKAAREFALAPSPETARAEVLRDAELFQEILKK